MVCVLGSFHRTALYLLVLMWLLALQLQLQVQVVVCQEAPVATAPSITLSIPTDAFWNYSISVDQGQTTLFQSHDIAFYLNEQWVSGQRGNLLLKQRVDSHGQDVLGHFDSTVLQLRSATNASLTFECEFRTYVTSTLSSPYSTFITFTQRFLSAVDGCSLVDENVVSTSFPAFQRDSSKSFLSYGGAFLEDTVIERWNHSTEQHINSGLAGGPLFFFDDALQTFAVLAPLSNFMVHNVYEEVGVAVHTGLLGSIEFIPSNFELTTVLLLNSHGFTSTLQDYGDLLLLQSNKSSQTGQQDETNHYLQYNTDNGAVYYYHTLNQLNYADTLLAIHQDSIQRHIPYRAILLDSFWYYKGIANGVKNWTAMPSIFPHGIAPVYEQTHWFITAHNRYWSRDTDYAHENGGAYHFLLDKVMAMPQDVSFWVDLLRNASQQWGLRVYEQDWLYNEFEGVHAAISQVYVARDWLQGMGVGAAQAHVQIQYCMPWPRHILTSADIPAVSQVRASDDAVPNSNQWNIGISTHLAAAVGLAPFKDNFWSEPIEPTNPYNQTEYQPSPALESMIATLSTGPVSIGDALGYSHRQLIMRCCREDGRVLAPSVPVRAIDAQIYAATGVHPVVGPTGNVWITHTTLQSGQVFFTLLTTNLATNYTFTYEQLVHYSQAVMSREKKQTSPGILLNDPSSVLSSYVVFAYANNNASSTNVNSTLPDPVLWSRQLFQPLTTLDMPACGTTDFIAYYLFPFQSDSSVTFLGDLSKWVPFASARYSSIQYNTVSVEAAATAAAAIAAESQLTTLTVELNGEPGEVVTTALLNHRDFSLSYVNATIQQDGTGSFTWKEE